MILYANASQEVWKHYCFVHQINSYFDGAHMDLKVIVPFLKKPPVIGKRVVLDALSIFETCPTIEDLPLANDTRTRNCV